VRAVFIGVTEMVCWLFVRY